MDDLVKELREEYRFRRTGPYAEKAADEIERLRAALREKDSIAYIVDGHGITHNTFTIVYKGENDD